MINTLIKLKNEVKNNAQVKNSILGYTDAWKTSHYTTLSAIINENLMKNPLLQGEKKFQIGNTISPITLKRFFEDQFSDSASNDLRFLKTLDKICIFIGYNNFNDFIDKNKNDAVTISSQARENIENYVKSDFENIIRSCAKLEFDSICNLPNIEMDELEKYVIKDSPYHDRIRSYLQKLLIQKYFLNSEVNSNYELFNIEVDNVMKDSVVISTSEFWNLNFLDEEGEPPSLPHHEQPELFFEKN